jgi:uracil-DNA glycosylase family 4
MNSEGGSAPLPNPRGGRGEAAARSGTPRRVGPGSTGCVPPRRDACDGGPERAGPRAAALRRLQAEIVACRRCPRLVAHREAVAEKPPRRFQGQRYWARPVPSLGAASARLLLVGLAPAAHGGNRTGRMFTGDAAGGSGEWVARALHAHGLATRPASRHRGDGFRLVGAYITAPIHCAPPGNRPLPGELRCCAGYLEAELRLLRHVRVVVALGRIGFDAYLRAMRALGHELPRPKLVFRHGAAVALPWGPTLLCSYHPSRQNTQTGRLTWAMFDAVFAAARRRLDARPRS